MLPPGFGPGDLVPVALGVAITVLVAAFSVHAGAAVGLGALVGVFLFLTVLVAFVKAPHIAVAFTVVYFCILPSLNVLVADQLAPTKDVIEIAALLAALILALQRRASKTPWNGDRLLLILVLLLAGLYIVNVGPGLTGGPRYDVAWFHGVRLVAEPLSLLIVGLSVENPRRTLRWALAALIATAYGEALIGLFEQQLGSGKLVDLGFEYGRQIRTIGGNLRSFGSFDEPFDYAAMMAFGLAGALFWMKRGFAALAAIVIGLGLAVSLVRGAAFSVVILLALLLARKGKTVGAVFLLGIAIVSGAVFMFTATQETNGRVVQVGPSQYGTLNGRTKSWPAALGKPEAWVFGRGVGQYGTAAERARKDRPPVVGGGRSTAAADSGYLATTADVGFIGLALLLAILGRMLVLLRRGTARGEDAAWFGVAIIVVFMVDAALRSSLTGFPAAHLGMLLIGLSLAATKVSDPSSPTYEPQSSSP
jgi:O-antigen ligase/polysaccharide polymerase Wzy-like membrane protein